MKALQASVNAIDTKRQVKGKYAFWETQPVAQFKEDIASKVIPGHASQADRSLTHGRRLKPELMARCLSG